MFGDAPGMERVVPISPIERTWYKGKVQSSRTTIPCVPAYAYSTHVSQVLLAALQKVTKAN